MKVVQSVIVLCAVSTATAFAPLSNNKVTASVSPAVSARTILAASSENNQEENVELTMISSSTSSDIEVGWMASTAAAMTTAALMMPAQSAMAAGPDWGLFEGRSASMIHPIVMGGLFLYSCYTAFLGFQWRRQRTVGDDISALKATLPAAPEGEAVEDAAIMAQYEASIAPINSEISALQQERKDIASSNPRDKHFSQGALLAFLGTAIAIEGCLNTFGRAGKLFPGPHLYAGAGLVVLWGLAVSTIPAMQKGNDTARSIHIGANVASLGMFAWQIQSGIPILLKVWEKTSWP